MNVTIKNMTQDTAAVKAPGHLDESGAGLLTVTRLTLIFEQDVQNVNDLFKLSVSLRRPHRDKEVPQK
jgi:hypothetical protein